LAVTIRRHLALNVMSLSFTELVGLELAKQALLLLAVNPALAGAAIAAAVGSGKSTLARSFAALLPSGTPFVELPVNVTEDRLLGGLDLEATLAAGRRVIERGLLARAHGGVLYVDGLNLLDGDTTALLLGTMADGMVRLEREGLSDVHPARFTLVGTYDPADGEVRRGLLDRLGLIVPFAPQTDERLRAEVVRRNMSASGNGATNAAFEDDATQMLRAMLADAHERLPSVRIEEEQIRALIQTALSLGVEGNRADGFAVQAALAKAALDGRSAVDDDDLRLAVRLVLLPRATQMPEARDGHQAEEDRQTQERDNEEAGENPDESNAAPRPESQQIEDLLLSAAEAELPENLLGLPFVMQRRGKSGSRGMALNSRRGRFVRAVEGSPRENRIALLPTLLAAAPWQRLRRIENDALSKQKTGSKAAPSSTPNAQLSIRPQDIRVKRFRDKAGMLYIFVVDASGSMAINRMREAKGAVVRLLQDAYVHRDQVGLIAFRGRQAQVLLAPSQSVERAKRELDVLPTGGGTPLASALLTAWQMARQARQRGIAQATLILMTDGRGNVPLHVENDESPPSAQPQKAQIQAELQKLAALICADRINAIVIDTQVNYLSRGEAPRLAEWLGGRYIYLPNARAEQIAKAVS
jgi:magnesium chelatase subunit D